MRLPTNASLAGLVFPLLALSACTGQLPGSFRFAQQEEGFSAKIDINTKIDLLWVVDNSSSMDVSQEKLRAGFNQFATKYMQPTWDIRVAVITTDTYLANSAFQPYLDSKLPGTTNYRSPYIYSRLGTFVNPSYNSSLVNLSTGRFDSGIRYKEMVPVWGPSFARLLPGLHDGPIPALCFEGMPYFLRGLSNCAIRDDQAAYNGISHCLTPSSGESSASQCVNTVQNDTVRSGKAIIETMPPTGTPGDATWTQQLVQDFTVNVTTGSVGHGSERGLGSVAQLLADNEPSATAFFRPGSVRGIIFVSDEDDQTLEIESAPAADFNPWSHYGCDQTGLVAMNPTRNITGNNGICCSTAGNNCRYGIEGTSCAAKTVDSHTYTVSFCAKSASLMPVASVKTRLDDFFLDLDGNTAVAGAEPGYFVVSIVPLTGASISTLQALRDQDDVNAGGIAQIATDRGDRYLELGTLVGNGSLALDIGESDYTEILESIGQALIEKEGTFTLTRAPTGSEDMIVSLLHSDGTITAIPADKFVIVDRSLTITDINVILSFRSDDQVVINYQPKTAS